MWPEYGRNFLDLQIAAIHKLTKRELERERERGGERGGGKRGRDS